MEALAVSGLLGTIGYLVSRENNNKEEHLETVINKGEKPSVNNTYSSDNFNASIENVVEKNNKIYNKSLKSKSNLIPLNKKHIETDKNVYSRLADVEMSKDQFKHENMVPYFGSKITQNTDMNNRITQDKLENFTGTDRFYKKKQEVENFADIKNNIGNVFGSQNNTTFEQTRYVNERFVNNYLPFKQERVGPGLDAGYTAEPSGGLQQENKRKFELPKNVDELRTQCDPKITYEGRTVDGQKGSLRGKIGDVCKNKVETSHEQTFDMYLKGGNPANLKESQRPCVDLKTTNRSSTGVKTHNTNITSIVKSLTAPLFDTAKLSKKEYTIMNGRPLGNLQSINPDKMTVYDPNDIARTTIKESTIHNKRIGITTGMSKTIMYNPDEVARVTLRQSTENKTRKGNVGYQGADAYKFIKVVPKDTDRQFTSDIQYYGVGDSKDDKEMSRENMENADINETRDILLKNRKPTKTSVKLFNEIDNTNITHKNLDKDSIAERSTHNYGKIINTISTTNNINLTKDKFIYKNLDRINPEILSARNTNPYAKPLNVF